MNKYLNIKRLLLAFSMSIVIFSICAAFTYTLVYIDNKFRDLGLIGVFFVGIVVVIYQLLKDTEKGETRE